MDYTIKVVDEVPESRQRKGPRQSRCLDVLAEAERVQPRAVQVTFPKADELSRFYRSLMQWKARHTERPIGLRKVYDALYVWIPAAQLATDPATAA